jgi:transposase
MAGRERRKFSPEFKAETVKLVRESGNSVSEFARELDLTETALRTESSRPTSTGARDRRGFFNCRERGADEVPRGEPHAADGA